MQESVKSEQKPVDVDQKPTTRKLGLNRETIRNLSAKAYTHPGAEPSASDHGCCTEFGC